MTIEPLHRTKKAVYLGLVSVALLMSGFAIYNQLSSDSTKDSLANQVATACTTSRLLAEAQGLNCQQAKDVQSSGAPVVKGEKGDKGDLGLKGDQGPQGVQGDVGPVGPQGVPGIAGVDGEDGEPGSNGVNGEQGPQGEQGTQGDQGERGADGTPGADAPVITSVAIVSDPCRLEFTFDTGTVLYAPITEELCM